MCRLRGVRRQARQIHKRQEGFLGCAIDMLDQDLAVAREDGDQCFGDLIRLEIGDAPLERLSHLLGNPPGVSPIHDGGRVKYVPHSLPDKMGTPG